jgi:hypothetical protein
MQKQSKSSSRDMKSENEMGTARKKSAIANSANARSKGENKTIIVDQKAYGRRPGDMDILELHAGSPMPTAFEQIDRTYRAMHTFLGWPSAIV